MGSFPPSTDRAAGPRGAGRRSHRSRTVVTLRKRPTPSRAAVWVAGDAPAVATPSRLASTPSRGDRGAERDAAAGVGDQTQGATRGLLARVPVDAFAHAVYRVPQLGYPREADAGRGWTRSCIWRRVALARHAGILARVSEWNEFK